MGKLGRHARAAGGVAAAAEAGGAPWIPMDTSAFCITWDQHGGQFVGVQLAGRPSSQVITRGATAAAAPPAARKGWPCRLLPSSGPQLLLQALPRKAGQPCSNVCGWVAAAQRAVTGAGARAGLASLDTRNVLLTTHSRGTGIALVEEQADAQLAQRRWPIQKLRQLPTKPLACPTATLAFITSIPSVCNHPAEHSRQGKWQQMR